MDRLSGQLQDTIVDSAHKMGIPMSRRGLTQFMEKVSAVLSHTGFTQQLGTLGQSYKHVDTALSDALHTASRLRSAQRTVHVHVPTQLVAVLVATIQETLRDIYAAQERRGEEAAAAGTITILQPLARLRDLAELQHHMRLLQQQMERWSQRLQLQHASDSDKAQQGDVEVDWHSVCASILSISDIARDAISERNARVHAHSETAFAESIAVGISLRVATLTAFRLLHAVRQLHPDSAASTLRGATATPAEEELRAQQEETHAWVSPLGDAVADARAARTIRLMQTIGFRCGFAGAGWVIPGDAALHALAVEMTQTRWLPWVRRLLRRAGDYVGDSALVVLRGLMFGLVTMYHPIQAITRNPIVLLAVNILTNMFLYGAWNTARTVVFGRS